jgi:uncharacterized repeat protein (TIGR04076 family)
MGVRGIRAMKLVVNVTESKCTSGIHKKGDYFEVREVTPSGMCVMAWDAISPFLRALDFGGQFPFMIEDKTIHSIRCPSPVGGIVMEIGPAASYLKRIKGIEKFIGLLEAADVDSVKILSQAEPKDLLRKMTAANKIKPLANLLPKQEEVARWIKEATVAMQNR